MSKNRPTVTTKFVVWYTPYFKNAGRIPLDPVPVAMFRTREEAEAYTGLRPRTAWTEELVDMSEMPMVHADGSRYSPEPGSR